MSLNLPTLSAAPRLWRLDEFFVIRDCAGVTLSENHSGEKRLLILPVQRLAAIYVPSPRFPDDGCATLALAGCAPDEARNILKVGADVLPDGPNRPDYGEIRFPDLVDSAMITSYIGAIFSRQHRGARNANLTALYWNYRVFVGAMLLGRVALIASRMRGGQDAV